AVLDALRRLVDGLEAAERASAGRDVRLRELEQDASELRNQLTRQERAHRMALSGLEKRLAEQTARLSSHEDVLALARSVVPVLAGRSTRADSEPAPACAPRPPGLSQRPVRADRTASAATIAIRRASAHTWVGCPHRSWRPGQSSRPAGRGGNTERRCNRLGP